MLIGYYLEIKKANPKEMLSACIESVIDTCHLENVIYNCLTEIKT